MDPLSSRPVQDYGGRNVPAVICHCAELGRFHGHLAEPSLADWYGDGNRTLTRRVYGMRNPESFTLTPAVGLGHASDYHYMDYIKKKQLSA